MEICSRTRKRSDLFVVRPNISPLPYIPLLPVSDLDTRWDLGYFPADLDFSPAILDSM